MIHFCGSFLDLHFVVHMESGSKIFHAFPFYPETCRGGQLDMPTSHAASKNAPTGLYRRNHRGRYMVEGGGDARDSTSKQVRGVTPH
jgi:hypothetical protein